MRIAYKTKTCRLLRTITAFQMKELKVQKSVFEVLLIKILLSVAVLYGIFAKTSVVWAEDSKESGIVWSEEFNSSTGPEGASVYYDGWKSGKSKPELLIKEINNGICRYGIKRRKGGIILLSE